MAYGDSEPFINVDDGVVAEMEARCNCIVHILIPDFCDQSNVLLMDWVSAANNMIEPRFLDWSVNLKCPSSSFMSKEEMDEFSKEWYMEKCIYKVEAGCDTFKKIIAKNRASPNGKHLSWKEIKELYGW